MIDRVLFATAELRRRVPVSRIEPVPDEDLEMLASSHVGLPQDYILFLRHYGYGSIGDGRFMIYGGPIDPSEIYDPVIAQSLPGILLVGDNFSGDCLGYDPASSWRLGWISSKGEWEFDDTCFTFIDFIEDWFLNRNEE